jgi:CubicO group peptidase (beta-lactamase class C family)
MFSRVQFLVAAALFAFPAAGEIRVDPSEIDRVAAAALARNETPGIAVGIVTGDRTFFRGYGVRDLDDRRPVTPKTVFATGSVTKSVTALIAAYLVEEKKLEWDRPVREYLPWFRLYEEHAGALVTIRDMLSHRTGLPRYDFLRFAIPLSREELVRRLAFLPPTAGLRERYQYNNLMYVAAGYLEGERAGTTWEDLAEKRVLQPLGMTASSVRVSDVKRQADYAMPHEMQGGKLKEMEFYDYQKFGVGPNGALNANVEDLAKYLRFHMKEEGVVKELHRPMTIIDEETNYALGWQLNGREVTHGGSITGFRAHIGFTRGVDLGVIVLMNGPGNATRLAAELRAAILDTPPPVSRTAPTRTPAPPKEGVPARSLTAYEGRYQHPAFGVCEVSEEGGKLTIEFPAYRSALRPAGGDQFTTRDGRDVQFAGAEMRFRVEEAAPLLPFRKL